MSQDPSSLPVLPAEPPELQATRERLLAILETEAPGATGTAQPLLRSLHALLVNTRPGEPFNPGLYDDVKAAIARFMKDPVFPPPPVLMECMTFMQERQAAFLMATATQR